MPEFLLVTRRHSEQYWVAAGRSEELNGSWGARLLFHTTLQRQTGKQKPALTHTQKADVPH